MGVAFLICSVSFIQVSLFSFPLPLPKYNLFNFHTGYATAHSQLLSLHKTCNDVLHNCVTIWKAVRNLISPNLQDLLSTILLAKQAWLHDTSCGVYRTQGWKWKEDVPWTSSQPVNRSQESKWPPPHPKIILEREDLLMNWQEAVNTPKNQVICSQSQSYPADQNPLSKVLDQTNRKGQSTQEENTHYP